MMKLFLSTLLVLYSVTALHAASPEDILALWLELKNDNTETTIKLSLADKKEGLVLGERIKIEVSANSECYLTLLNLGSSGNLAVLLPNQWRPKFNLEPNQVIQIPQPGSEFAFKLTGPAGTERLKAVVTKKPILLHVRNYPGPKDRGKPESKEEPVKPEDILLELRSKLADMPETDWGASDLGFAVVAPPAAGQLQGGPPSSEPQSAPPAPVEGQSPAPPAEPRRPE
jgi:hypothetical protein